MPRLGWFRIFEHHPVHCVPVLGELARQPEVGFVLVAGGLVVIVRLVAGAVLTPLVLAVVPLGAGARAGWAAASCGTRFLSVFPGGEKTYLRKQLFY